MNTFGTASQQFPLYDPRCIREHRERFRRDAFPELDLCNSYYSMAGRWPDMGWLLIDRNSYNQLDPYSNDLQLTIGDFINSPLILSNISIIQARCVTRGLLSDPAAVYLLQVTNNQGILYNPWFQFPTTAQYNVRAPGYDGIYYSGTIDGTTVWTWDAMVEDLWNQAGSLLGTYPHLPITPASTPENFIFVGVSLWEAISRVMDYLGLAISGSFPNFTIVVPGAADGAYSALAKKYKTYLEDSMEYLDIGSGRVPGQVDVYFHRRNEVYGTEETVRYDAPQWQNTPLYVVSVLAPALFTDAVGVGYLWADFTVRYDQDGVPLAADVTTAEAVAAERVAQFFNTIYRGTQGFMCHVYSGVLPFTTGSLVDGVRWFNTGMLGNMPDPRGGWRTEVIRGYIWREATFPLTLKGLTGPD